MKSIIRYIIMRPLVSLLISTLTLIASGQSPAGSYIHTDRELYSAGEKIAFAFYNLRAHEVNEITASLPAYIEVINGNGLPVSQLRIMVRGNLAGGTIPLPDTLSSGYYTVRAYTRELRNEGPAAFYSKDIFVYNPFGKDPSGVYPVFNNNQPIERSHSEETISKLTVLETVNDVVGTREKVTVRLKPDPEIFRDISSSVMSLSVAITPGTIPQLEPGLINGHLNSDASRALAETAVSHVNNFRSEEFGPYMDGTVISRSGLKPVEGLRLLLSIPGRETFLQYSVSDSNGRFRFILPVSEERLDYIIQPADFSSDYIIKVLSSFDERFIHAPSGNAEINREHMRTLTAVGINYQLEKIFGGESAYYTDSIRLAKQDNSFYKEPDLEIKLSDYIDLPTMEEVFHELVPGVALRKVGDKPGFVFVNELTGERRSVPGAVFLDGVILDDPSVIATMDPDLIERIEVVRRDYQLGNMILRGFISIFSREADMCGIEYPNNGIRISQRLFTHPVLPSNREYESSEQISDRIPDFRNRLWWSAGSIDSNSGEIEFSFYTSDYTSSYRIILQGLTDLGTPFVYTKVFRVAR